MQTKGEYDEKNIQITLVLAGAVLAVAGGLFSMRNFSKKTKKWTRILTTKNCLKTRTTKN